MSFAIQHHNLAYYINNSYHFNTLDIFLKAVSYNLKNSAVPE